MRSKHPNYTVSRASWDTPHLEHLDLRKQAFFFHLLFRNDPGHFYLGHKQTVRISKFEVQKLMLKKQKFQFRHWDRVHRHGGYLSFYWCICFGFWGWYWWVGHFRSRRGNRHSGGAIFCNYRSPRCSAYKWYKTKLQQYLINFLVHFWKGYLFLRFISRFVYSKVPYKRSSIPNLPVMTNSRENFWV